MTTYAWTFGPLETANEGGKTDVVKVVHWRLTASDGDVSTPICGSAPLGKPKVPFVAFESLTETLVKSWVLDAIGESEADLKARVSAQLDAIQNPPLTQKEVPW